MKIMLQILAIYAIAATAAAWWGFGRNREALRLAYNQTVLFDSVRIYRTRLGEAAASVAALQLECSEYSRMHSDDTRRIRQLGLQLRRIESVATTAVETRTEIRTAAIRDTVFIGDSIRTFSWSDGWTSVEGVVSGDSAICRVMGVDTLRQIVHRVPRRFLFIRYGTRGIRQEIVAANPHNRIVAAEYVELTPRRKQRKRF